MKTYHFRKPLRSSIVVVGALLTLASISFAQSPLKPRQTPGTVARYVITTTDTTYVGKTKEKIKAEMTSRIPMQISVASGTAGGAKLEVIEGPVIQKGNTLNRPRVHHLNVDSGGALHGKSPAYFSIAFPAGGAKVGDSWKGGLYAPPPLPTIAPATYTFSGIQGPFAKITMAVNAYIGCRVNGTGEFFVRLSDGYIDHGQTSLRIEFLRPDKKNPRYVKVDSTDVIQYSIAQR